MSEDKPRYKGKRYSVMLYKLTADKIEKLAETEGRSFSQMLGKLIEEALEQREKNT